MYGACGETPARTSSFSLPAQFVHLHLELVKIFLRPGVRLVQTTPGKQHRAIQLPATPCILNNAESLASPTHVMPARTASHAPHVADTRRSSGVIRSKRAIVNFRSHAKKSILLFFEIPAQGGQFEMSVSVNETGQNYLLPRTIRASLAGNLASNLSQQVPTPAIRCPSTATAPFSIAAAETGSYPTRRIDSRHLR